jgi:hypothetical protein
MVETFFFYRSHPTFSVSIGVGSVLFSHIVTRCYLQLCKKSIQIFFPRVHSRIIVQSWTPVDPQNL